MINMEQFLNLTFDKDPVSWHLKMVGNKSSAKYDYSSSVQIFTNNFKLWLMSDIVNYWKTVNFEEINKKLNRGNWMYVYCIKYGFLNDLDEKDINMDPKYPKKTPAEASEFLSNLTPMSDDQIKKFLKLNPITIKKNILMNGFHRCCSMVGRLIRNESYINMDYENLQIRPGFHNKRIEISSSNVRKFYIQ